MSCNLYETNIDIFMTCYLQQAVSIVVCISLIVASSGYLGKKHGRYGN
jgi:hypothetical protein